MPLIHKIMNNKTTISFIIVAAMAVGFASAKLWSSEAKKRVNIFEEAVALPKTYSVFPQKDSMQIVYPLTFRGELSFAGEAVPLNDPEVAERLDRELQVNVFWHSNTLLNLKLANRYFGTIEKILAEEGVPNDFKYLPLIESGFRDAVSPAGAAGFWQFLAPTAKLYGLEVNSDVDERYNIEKATRAACAYLKQAKGKLGSWTAAAASYNIGIAGMEKRLATQRTDNYYDLLLTSETSRYVFRMLAMKVIFDNPAQTGFYVETEGLYQPYQYNTLVIDTAVSDIAGLADQFGLRYKHIKLLNPWLRSNELPNKSRKQYEIKIMY